MAKFQILTISTAGKNAKQKELSFICKMAQFGRLAVFEANSYCTTY